MSQFDSIKTVRVNTLEVGQKFQKIMFGVPCFTEYEVVNTLGGMVKATRLRDNSPYLLPNYALVHPLNK